MTRAKQQSQVGTLRVRGSKPELAAIIPRGNIRSATSMPLRLSGICDDIATHGNVNLTRLTILKKWFESSSRLRAFAVWVATNAKSMSAKPRGAAGALFRDVEALLANANPYAPELDRGAAHELHDRLKAFQNEYEHQQWAAVRIIHNWGLMLVEHALAIYLWHPQSTAHGYKLAANYCQNYDSRYGNGLNGPSRARITAMVRFLEAFEAFEAPGSCPTNRMPRRGPTNHIHRTPR